MDDVQLGDSQSFNKYYAILVLILVFPYISNIFEISNIFKVRIRPGQILKFNLRIYSNIDF